ncbi:hypothetical protein LUZ62_041302 [Rhynchospora pubera]|uniref:Uncharacterized protein n=1 Tax=Rhynchospora pubera TaxID=906938 RepID=A0AAV8FET1_9POAL|nr:hypothetical protein LUZ62_041302 [Rhynchospora pubera]
MMMMMKSQRQRVGCQGLAVAGGKEGKGNLNLNLLSRLPYSTEDSKVTEIAEKARSTAEEFLRQAKEKKNEISDATKETLENSKEAVLGETHQEKDKFKEKVEKGDYHRIGRP